MNGFIERTSVTKNLSDILSTDMKVVCHCYFQLSKSESLKPLLFAINRSTRSSSMWIERLGGKFQMSLHGHRPTVSK